MKNSIEKKELIKINTKLRSGDQKLIHDMTGFTTDYVRMVLDPNNARKSPKIIEAAKQVIENRETLIKEFQK